MKVISYIILLLSLASCAVFVRDSVRSGNAKKYDYRNLNLFLSAKFMTYVGDKYATLSAIDNTMNSVDSCRQIAPGEKNDPYLKNLLCRTYHGISQYYRKIPIVQNPNKRVKGKLLVMQYELNEKGNTFDSIWTWTNIITLTVIPYRGERKFNLSAELFIDGKKIKKYMLGEKAIEWRSIFLLPFFPLVDGHQAATDRVINILLSDLFEQLHRDNYL